MTKMFSVALLLYSDVRLALSMRQWCQRRGGQRLKSQFKMSASTVCPLANAAITSTLTTHTVGGKMRWRGRGLIQPPTYARMNKTLHSHEVDSGTALLPKTAFSK